MDAHQRSAFKLAIGRMKDKELRGFATELRDEVDRKVNPSEEGMAERDEKLDLIDHEFELRYHDREDGFSNVDMDEQDRRAYEEEKLDNLRREF